MTPDEVGAALVAALGDGTASVSGGDRWARSTVDVPVERWVDAVTAARDAIGCDFFDWLSAVDEQPRFPGEREERAPASPAVASNRFTVVTHLWSTSARHGVLLRTTVSGDDPAVPTVTGVFPGASWHERETHEMFGIDFPGHPNLVPLLLPPEFEGHPLRKDFVLASRVAKAWPGAKEPGESHVEGTARRQPMRPPGVPAPGEWGPG